MELKFRSSKTTHKSHIVQRRPFPDYDSNLRGWFLGTKPKSMCFQNMIIVAIEPVFNIRHKLACTSIEDSDQPAHPRSLIRVFDERSMGSQGSNVSSGGKLRLWPDCADARTDFNFRCMHMPTCTLCWVPACAKTLFRLCRLNIRIFFVPKSHAHNLHCNGLWNVIYRCYGTLVAGSLFRALAQLVSGA